MDRRTLAVWSFAEELYNRNREGVYVAYIQSARFNRSDQVVPGKSDNIGDPHENRETIHGDHISMVKFSMKNDPGYKKVII